MRTNPGKLEATWGSGIHEWQEMGNWEMRLTRRCNLVEALGQGGWQVGQSNIIGSQSAPARVSSSRRGCYPRFRHITPAVFLNREGPSHLMDNRGAVYIVRRDTQPHGQSTAPCGTTSRSAPPRIIGTSLTSGSVVPQLTKVDKARSGAVRRMRNALHLK